jgi:CheY-like chemotaxis protein
VRGSSGTCGVPCSVPQPVLHSLALRTAAEPGHFASGELDARHPCRESGGACATGRTGREAGARGHRTWPAPRRVCRAGGGSLASRHRRERRRRRRAGRRSQKRPVLVALTGYGRSEDKQRAQSAGLDHHLTKPVDIDALRERRRHSRRRRSRRARVLTSGGPPNDRASARAPQRALPGMLRAADQERESAIPTPIPNVNPPSQARIMSPPQFEGRRVRGRSHGVPSRSSSSGSTPAGRERVLRSDARR